MILLIKKKKKINYQLHKLNKKKLEKIKLKNKKKIKMNAEKIEQYKADSFSFAKNVEFKTFDDEGKDETSGSCDMISADTVKERYILLGDVKMDMISEDMKIEADSLNFDKKNEQITSGIDQKVTIKRNDIDMEGIGFSASGVSKTFAFDRDVAGEIETENEDEKKRTEPDGDKKQ